LIPSKHRHLPAGDLVTLDGVPLGEVGAHVFHKAARGPSVEIIAAAQASKAATPEFLSGETKVRAQLDEIDVQTLISFAIPFQAGAAEIFQVYPPALFGRIIGCEIMLGTGIAPADAGDIVPDVCRQTIEGSS
jgi:hypothetical protein